MPLCNNCGHPHGWYQGLCAACASAAGIELVKGPAPESMGIVSSAPEGETVETLSDTTTETVVGEEVEVEPEPKPRRRRSSKTGGE